MEAIYVGSMSCISVKKKGRNFSSEKERSPIDIECYEKIIVLYNFLFLNSAILFGMIYIMMIKLLFFGYPFLAKNILGNAVTRRTYMLAVSPL